jgi:mRNA interferase MazF
MSFMKRGEIWSINLEPTIGAEIRKTRPALVLSVDAIGALPLRVVVPITGWKDRFVQAPWLVRLEPDSKNNLDKLSAADAFQVRSVSESRFLERRGSLPPSDMARVEDAVRIALGLRMTASENEG